MGITELKYSKSLCPRPAYTYPVLLKRVYRAFHTIAAPWNGRDERKVTGENPCDGPEDIIDITTITTIMSTTIAVSEAVRDRLKSLGSKGDTYDEILARILDIVDRETYIEEVRRRLDAKKEFVDLDEAI